MAKSLYIHLPFCQRKCDYCDFSSLANSEHLIDNYLHALAVELKLLSSENKYESLSTVYIGGGTPTILSAEQLTLLFATISDNFSLDNELEYTIEANPGTLTNKKVAALKSAQINRVSLGAQAFQDELLSELGRIHNVSEIYQAVEQLRSAGIDNLSLDLMFGIPKQKMADLETSLEQVIELAVPHLSVYSLTVEEGTPFYKMQEAGELILPNESDELAMFQLTVAKLAEHGYDRYEISSYARPGFKSRHNQTYWLNQEYLAAGAGAHGYLNGIRYANQSNVAQYIADLSGSQLSVSNREIPSELLQAVQFTRHTPSQEEQKEDTMILGLRMLEGVSLTDYRERYGSDLIQDHAEAIEKLLALGLIAINAERIKLTEEGLLFGNQVNLEFLK